MNKNEPNYERYVLIGLVLTLFIFALVTFYWWKETDRLEDSAHALVDERVERGNAIYQEQCASCHGQQGEGGVGTALNDAQLLKNTLDEILFSVIRSGIPGKLMPAWSVDYGGSLTDEDIRDVVAYIRLWETSGLDTSELVSPDEGSIAATFKKGGCGGCHVIPGVAGAVGTIGPNLSDLDAVAQGYLQSGEYSGDATTTEEFIHESLVNPDAFVPTDCPTGHCPSGLMPANFESLLTEAELQAITSFLKDPPDDASETTVQDEIIPAGEAPALTEAEWAQATQIFFERCAGCHGVLRIGATGPATAGNVPQTDESHLEGIRGS
jgi:mono/diheme cytochrome c family protein